MGKFRNIIRDYFTFSRNERIGLYVLLGIIVLLLLVNHFIFYFETPGVIDKESFDQFVKSVEEEEKKQQQGLSLFKFNPNSIDSLGLDSLDLPSSIKWNLGKYLLKGGTFRYKEEFKKLYGMNDSIYSLVYQYLDLPEKPTAIINHNRDVHAKMNPVVKIDKRKCKKKSIKIIELNSASKDELKSIYGIGEVLSSRIIKYRNLLGGFYKTEQLKEVYGLSDETYESIKNKLEVDPSLVKKIDVNFASGNELVRHPYLKWEHVNSILAHKSKVGFIKTVDQLLDEKVLNDTICIKMSPYFKTKKP